MPAQLLQNSTCIHSGCAEGCLAEPRDIRYGHESCETGDDFVFTSKAVFFSLKKKVSIVYLLPHTDNKQVQCNTVFRIWLSLFIFF